MRITEFKTEITATALNESAAKQFGQKLNLESFTLEQLEDARNKLRTKIYQFENSANFSAVNESESHAKNRMFLDVLNHAIDERATAPGVMEFTDMERLVLGKVDEGVIDFDSLPDELQAKIKHVHETRLAAEQMLAEGEEEKAEFIMSARDMVDRITGWMEDTANMQAENMLKLVDAIRDELGNDLAMEFESIIKPSLATVYTALESSRTQLNLGVMLLTGEGEGSEMMGSEPAMGGDDMGGEDMGGDDMGSEEATPDDFAASAPSAGGEEAAGRATRESVEYGRRLATLLAPKKK
jgi:bacterioferritin (cytochrome b1)